MEFRRARGLKQTLWFDNKSGLLAPITHRRDQYDWNEELSVWRMLAGRKRATVRTIGLPQFASSCRRTDIDSVWAELPKGANPEAAFAPPASTAAPVSWLGGRGRIELPFQCRRGHVWVMLGINGQAPAEFVLDTGAFNTCLDRNYARSIGLNAEGEYLAEGVGGYDTFGFTRLQSLRWATPAGKGVELRDLRAGVIALQSGLSSVEWGRTAGLLGYDVLSRFTLELDFDRQILTLYDPATYQHAGPGTPIPMTLNGNIGTTVLERFRCTFDYAHGTLWLDPGVRHAQREAFTRWAGVVIVFGIVKDSPAAEAGLKVRDVLRAINGKPIDRWTPEQLDQLLQDGPAGGVVKLTYERELREQTVELLLADVL